MKIRNVYFLLIFVDIELRLSNFNTAFLKKNIIEYFQKKSFSVLFINDLKIKISKFLEVCTGVISY